jgi:hypothetical protein
MDEREVTQAWRTLFRDQVVTPEALAKADALLDGLSGESPLHLRLANELQDLKNRDNPPKPKARAKARPKA